MTGVARDDAARLRVAYERHRETLFDYALRRTGSLQDAEEVVAATFAIAWQRIDRMAPEPYTLTWLYRVAWRTLANERRSRTRRQQLAGRLARNAVPLHEDATDQEGLVHEALARLSAKDREALWLDAWGGFSYAEAAELLGCSQNAFALRLHRARRALREELLRLEGRPGLGGPPPRT